MSVATLLVHRRTLWGVPKGLPVDAEWGVVGGDKGRRCFLVASGEAEERGGKATL